MINPFYMSAVSFLITILVFSLKWSGHYQQLDIKIYLFFALNILINSIFGFLLKGKLKFEKLEKEDKKLNKLIFFVFIGYLINFSYAKEIPFINMFFGIGTYYKDIEMIPTFYPFLVSLNVFSTVYAFYHYLSFKEKRYFYYTLFLLFPIIMISGRGIFLMIVIPCMLIFYASKTVKYIIRDAFRIIVILLVSLYIFGYAGNIRSAENQQSGLNLNEQILSLGDAVDDFRKSIFPDEFFWAYLYIASPVANLNELINNSHEEGNIVEFVILNFFPQSLQKYSMAGDGMDTMDYLVVETFNVSTAYAIPYRQFGWLGIVLYQIGCYAFFGMCFIILRKSQFKSIFLSLYSVTVVLSLFSNMLVLDVLMIPIILSLLFHVMHNIKIKSVE